MGDRKEPTPYDGSPKPPPPPAPPSPRRIFGSGFQEPSINEKAESEKDRELQELADKMIEHVPKNIEAIVGDDETTRREKAMGLDIDKRTGRAYQSQGDAANLTSGLTGRFHDGIMVPRSFQCDACGQLVVETKFGVGFPNCAEIFVNPGQYRFTRCGSINMGPGGHFNLCGNCIEKAVMAIPNLAGLCSAVNGGRLHRRG